MIKITYKKLKKFGFYFFGPLLCDFIFKLHDKLKLNSNTTLFLMREGYFLHKLYNNHLIRTNELCEISKNKKLYVSRSFLFSLSILSNELFKESLRFKFNGLISELLKFRYYFPDYLLNSKKLKTHIRLPDDSDIVYDIVKNMPDKNEEYVRDQFNIYGEYLKNLVRTKEVNIVDIGYSGTTQFFLSHIYNIRSNGYYMYMTRKFKKTRLTRAEGLIVKNVNFREGNMLIDWSLVLESLLTSPNGQLKSIFRKESSYDFSFKNDTESQDKFYFLQSIIDGVDDFINTCYNNKITLDRINLERLYFYIIANDRSDEMLLFRDIANIDDTFNDLGYYNIFKKLNF